jgi:hypothetical protein
VTQRPPQQKTLRPRQRWKTRTSSGAGAGAAAILARFPAQVARKFAAAHLLRAMSHVLRKARAIVRPVRAAARRPLMSWSTTMWQLDKWTTNQAVKDWVIDRMRLLQPDMVAVCDGSENENELLLKQMVRTGTLIKLDEKQRCAEGRAARGARARGLDNAVQRAGPPHRGSVGASAPRSRAPRGLSRVGATS